MISQWKRKTKKYIRDKENWIQKHLFWDDNASSRDKKYDWFNVYGSEEWISKKIDYNKKKSKK